MCLQKAVGIGRAAKTCNDAKARRALLFSRFSFGPWTTIIIATRVSQLILLPFFLTPSLNRFLPLIGPWLLLSAARSDLFFLLSEKRGKKRAAIMIIIILSRIIIEMLGQEERKKDRKKERKRRQKLVSFQTPSCLEDYEFGASSFSSFVFSGFEKCIRKRIVCFISSWFRTLCSSSPVLPFQLKKL